MAEKLESLAVPVAKDHRVGITTAATTGGRLRVGLATIVDTNTVLSHLLSSNRCKRQKRGASMMQGVSDLQYLQLQPRLGASGTIHI